MPREFFSHASLNARFSVPNRSSDGREGKRSNQELHRV